MASNAEQRGTWASRFGFILAASGSAVGLGNLWRFPYVTGENGGGLFVMIYLACIGAVGLPILVAEIAIGRATQRSTVTALRTLTSPSSGWVGLGWLGVVATILVGSVYSVVAGWALHYAYLSLTGGLAGLGPQAVQELFGGLYTDGALNLLWALIFLTLTTAVVLGGVRKGIERWSRILMPALFLILVVLLLKALTLDGFGEAVRFVFGFHAHKLTPAGVLEALGHSFFTLGVGVGVMVTYGSYLRREANIVTDALAVVFLDTLIALLACVVLFPITFTYGLQAGEGPGLVFTTLPIAFAQMPAGGLLAALFFILLVFAALTSAISVLEVPTAYLIDEWGWGRRKATLAAAGLIGLLSVPAALTGATRLLGQDLERLVGRNWFDLVLDSVSNVMLPLGGLGFAIFGAWRWSEAMRRAQFPPGLPYGLYRGWLLVLRYVVPLAVILTFLHAVGFI